MKSCVAVLLLATICIVKAEQLTVTDQAYFDITIGNEDKGRIEMGLFGNDAPKTVKNFLAICKDGINGKTYAGSKFHRVIKKFMIQGGDIENGDGTGSISIYGKYFPDEPNGIKHVGAGFLSMANAGKDTNGCQFFITTIATPWLDGHHTVFGKVSKNQGLVHTIEQTETDSDDHPLKEVKIKACGIIPTPSPFKLVDSPYDLWEWIKVSSIPLSWTFAILIFFQWVIRKLDVVG
ncbi:peptidyl-prolyl cis-trans isomerase B [Ischnura elegans]|uniref:peptidyl-prolyl cis-trans isomerase B n=1 Tax=Ischnura elegans TaxID=197161 RepID=UPI001ED89123|nr:peptidyl-prolyl cis-trans isomerase B [Ischnura elegans]